MKKLISLILIVVVLAAGGFMVPKLLHTCDDCEKVFVGPGYEPNALADLLQEDASVICKDCAEVHHAVSLALGKELKDFQKELF